MIHLYGAPMSSSTRCQWMLEEVGAEYELVLTNPRAPSAEFLQLQPGSRIPFLTDGDLHLAESMAINQYLAAKYKPELVGQSIVEQAKIDRWSYWAVSTLQPQIYRIFLHSQALAPEQRHASEIELGKAGIVRMVAELEGALHGDYLVGNRFTVADLNVAAVSGWLRLLEPDMLIGAPRIAAFLERCTARPAWQRAHKPATA